MSARRILQLGDPLLRQVSRPVTDLDRAASTLADLRDTLHQFQLSHGFGRGISAVQIGELDRIIYIEFAGISYELINPEFEWKGSEQFELWDDCFSFPDLLVRLKRSVSVRLHFQNAAGRRLAIETSGAFSELLQHEMDHLDGVLALDRVLDRDGFCTRDEYERRYRPQSAQMLDTQTRLWDL